MLDLNITGVFMGFSAAPCVSQARVGTEADPYRWLPDSMTIYFDNQWIIGLA